MLTAGLVYPSLFIQEIILVYLIYKWLHVGFFFSAKAFMPIF